MTGWKPPVTLPDLRNCDLVALDTETDDERLREDKGSGWPMRQGRIVGISAAWRNASDVHKLYVPIAHPDSANFDKAQVAAWLKDLFASGTRLVFHNSLYDLGWIRAEFGIKPPSPELDDTNLMAVMVDENRREGYSLDALCKWRGLPGKDETLLREAVERLGIDCGKSARNSPQAHLWRLPAESVGPYAEQDTVSTLLLRESLDPLLDQEGAREAYKLEIAMLAPAQDMRLHGIRVDTAAAERNRSIMLAKYNAVLVELSAKLGEPVDITDLRDNRWMKDHCDRLGISYEYTEKGNPSFRGAPLGWTQHCDHWFIQLGIKAKKYHDAAEKFLLQYVLNHAVNGRIFPEIRPYRTDEGGTRSFRFSYSDPPLQQMCADEETAPAVRGVFLPEEGQTWASIDYNQQELRIAVDLAETLKLPGAADVAEHYRNDPAFDLHELAAAKLGIKRPEAKRLNFGYIYGIGDKTLGRQLGVPKDEATAIRARYVQDFPFMHALAKHYEALVERNGYVELWGGARRHFNLWEARYVKWTKEAPPCDYEQAVRNSRTPGHPWFGEKLRRAKGHAGLNAVVQSTAAHQAKLWISACYREGLLPLFSLHDELDFSVTSPEQAERAAQIARDVLCLRVPMQTETKYGLTWGSAKYTAWGDIPQCDPVPDAVPATATPKPRITTAFTGTPRTGDFVLLNQFVAFVTERHAVYGRRKAGLPREEWTNDQILARWSFCNMYRHLDKTTAWIWDNWCVPHADDPDLWFAMVIARLINHIPTLETLGFPVPWDPEHFRKVMARRPKGGMYGSAYVIPAFKGGSGTKYIDQMHFIFDPMWRQREKLRPRPGMSCEEFSLGLQAFDNMGKS
jgi:DNA polymerase I-like protein with 3'-5' exonuclease and polymerase domains